MIDTVLLLVEVTEAVEVVGMEVRDTPVEHTIGPIEQGQAHTEVEIRTGEALPIRGMTGEEDPPLREGRGDHPALHQREAVEAGTPDRQAQDAVVGIGTTLIGRKEFLLPPGLGWEVTSTAPLGRTMSSPVDTTKHPHRPRGANSACNGPQITSSSTCTICYT